MTTKEFLIDQFTSNYDTDGWFVALKNTFKGLSAADAAWKPEGVDNSIWGIIRHLNFYNERYLKRFRNEPVEEFEFENSETFAGAETVSEEAWASEIERFERVMDGWRTAFEAAAEERFGQSFSEEKQETLAEIIGLMNMHHAHHGGQIVILRKLQGSWDASKGVS
ncbi:MAG: DinB family protein [Pyrinomonadaceae bacterium]